jgi:tetratricopeptide (TPR) repeat protein
VARANWRKKKAAAVERSRVKTLAAAASPVAANASTASTGAATAGAAKPAAPKWRLRLLLVLLILVVGFALARWFLEGPTATLPELPVLALDGVDPEVAKTLADARAAVQRAPRSVKAWAQLAMLLDAHQFEAEALTCYEAAALLDPYDPYLPYLHACLLLTGPNPDKALPILERSIRLAPPDWPAPRLRLADQLLALGRLDDAAKEYDQVLAGNRNNNGGKFGLAQVAVARQQYQAALPYLEALAGDPHLRKRASALKTMVHERLGNRQEADEERRRFAGLADDTPPPDVYSQVLQLRTGLRGRIAQANRLRHQGKAAEALSLIQETVELYPQNDQAWLVLAIARQYENDFYGAEQALLKSIELAPERAELRFRLGEHLQSQKRWQEAVTVYRKAAELSPLDAATWLKLGECLKELRDYPGAAEAFRQALRYAPDLSAAREGLAKVDGKK